MTFRGHREIDHVRCPGGGKVCYSTKAIAKDALRRMRDDKARHKRNLDTRLHVYECQTCYLWHVGTDYYKETQ